MKSPRALQGARRVDIQALRGAISAQETTTSLGIVRLFPGEDSHFIVSTENGSREILVDVELIPSGTRVTCRLGFGGDGIFRIPRVNQEVAVLLPYESNSLIRDPMDGGPIIVGILDTEAPSQLVDDQIVVLSATKVHVLSDDVRLGDTASDPVARKSDVDALVNKLNSLIGKYDSHAHGGVTTGGGVSGPTPAVETALPPLSYSSNTKVK